MPQEIRALDYIAMVVLLYIPLTSRRSPALGELCHLRQSSQELSPEHWIRGILDVIIHGNFVIFISPRVNKVLRNFAIFRMFAGTSRRLSEKLKGSVRANLGLWGSHLKGNFGALIKILPKRQLKW